MDQKVYLNKYSIGSPHCEYLFPMDHTVIFTNEERGIRKRIVDREGRILDFPGVEYTEALVQVLGKRELGSSVRYESSFVRSGEGGFVMRWTVRPDGMYWADSWGFGAEDEEAVQLYARIDENGSFTGPFRLQRIGQQEVEADGYG